MPSKIGAVSIPNAAFAPGYSKHNDAAWAPLMGVLSGCVFLDVWGLVLAVGAAVVWAFWGYVFPALSRYIPSRICAQQVGALAYAGTACLVWNAAAHADSTNVAAVLAGTLLAFLSFSAWLCVIELGGVRAAGIRLVVFAGLGAAVPLLGT